MSEAQPYDIAIIGAGPAGYVGAIRAAQLGANVVLVEKGPLGGTCLNRGCIPTKTLLAGAELLHEIRRAKQYGLEVGKATFDWPAMMKRKDGTVRQLNKGVEGLLKRRKVTVLGGTASLETPNRLRVDGAEPTTVQARHTIIATGSVPAMIPGWPTDRRVCSSDHALAWKKLPESLLIVGGGVIGCEFACLYNELGVTVSVVEMLPEFLPGLDGELGAAMRQTLSKRGVDCKVAARVDDLKLTDDGVAATLSDGTALDVKQVLVAVGRRPYTDGLGLDEVGVNNDRGQVTVDEHLRTNVPGVWAVGDCVPGPMLAHKASEDAIVAVENILGQKRSPTHVVPSCIYTFPECASVGLSAEQAREAGHPISVGRFPFAASGKAMARADTEGFVKVVRHRQTEQILGVHMFGHNVTELVASAGAFIQQKATAHDVLHTVFSHPTLSETVKEATEDSLGQAIHIPPRNVIKLKAP